MAVSLVFGLSSLLSARPIQITDHTLCTISRASQSHVTTHDTLQTDVNNRLNDSLLFDVNFSCNLTKKRTVGIRLRFSHHKFMDIDVAYRY